MSRSRKDGPHRGSHLEARRTGKEYWSARGRGKLAMADWGTLKREVHKQERRRHKAALVAELKELNDMNDEDFWTMSAMEVYGGHFIKSLGVCMAMADHVNLTKLKAAFPEYFAEYMELGRQLKAKNEEEKKNR